MKTSKAAPKQSATTLTLPPNTPDGVSRLVEIFSEHEEELRFPDIDASSLAASLEDVSRRRSSIEETLESLKEACAELAEAEQALLEKARRGHAYASIYATEAPEIQEALEEIKLGAPQRPPRKRRPTPSQKAGPEPAEGESSADGPNAPSDDATTVPKSKTDSKNKNQRSESREGDSGQPAEVVAAE